MALLAAYLGGALLPTLDGWIMAGVSQRMVRNVREGLFGKLQRLPLSFFDLRTHGDIMSRLTNDVDAVSVTVSQSAVQLMSSVVVVCGTLAIMLSLNPLLTGASARARAPRLPAHLDDLAEHARAFQGSSRRPSAR